MYKPTDIERQKLAELFDQFTEFKIYNHCCLLGYCGSIAHGTYIPDFIDDKDLMGIAVAPSSHYLGLKKFEHFRKQYDIWDVVIYDIKKMFNLLLKANPNVISLLWLPDDLFLVKTNFGERIIENRDLFATQQAYRSFVGYAHNQLKRMTRCSHKGYMGKKRKELVEKFGFDCKNAGHMIRLLDIGTEFMKTGQINVKRPNADFLIDIKNGRYSLEYIQEIADRRFKEMEEAKFYSRLPKKPNFEEVDKLLQDILSQEIEQEFITKQISAQISSLLAEKEEKGKSLNRK